MEALPHIAMPRNGIDAERLLAEGAWMRSLARGLVRDRDLAEEVVQDAYAAALARRPEPGRGLRPWLAAVVGNLARRVRAREAGRPAVEARAGERAPQGSAAELVERMELQRLLAEAVLALDEPYRGAVLLRHVEGCGAREIARRQGCTPDAARQRVARGLAALRRSLDGRLGGRSAWAALVAPLARSPLALLGTASFLGGVLVSAKSMGVVAAGVGLGILAWWGSARSGAEAWTEAAAAIEEERDAPHGAGGAAQSLPTEPPRAEREAVSVGVTPSAPGTVLAGSVRDVQGVPLENARVVLSTMLSEQVLRAALPKDRLQETWTDARGRFTLDAGDAEPVLWFLLDDHAAERIACTPGEDANVVLHALPAVEVRLHPRGPVDPGAPSAARLWIERADGTVEQRSVEPEDSGRLVARGLPPGRLVRARGRVRGALEKERALDVPLQLDRTERVDLDLERGATIRGVVLDDATGAPIPGAEVWAEDLFFDVDGSSPLARADDRGRFELRGVELGIVAEGRGRWVLLSAGAEGYSGELLDGHSWAARADETYEAELRLTSSTARLVLNVRMPDGTPVMARVFGFDGSGEMIAWVAGPGDFSFESAPGPLALEIATHLRGDRPRGSARLDLVLAPGETRREEVVLEPASGRVVGCVTDQRGRPVAGARVRLIRRFETERMMMDVESDDARTDADGQYAFEDVLVGRSVCGLVELPDGLVAAPRPEAFSLGPGETRTLDLACAPPMRLAGSVALLGRDPTAVRVVARSLEGRKLEASIVAADGSFAFPALYPAEVELVLEEDGEALASLRAGPRSTEGLVLAP